MVLAAEIHALAVEPIHARSSGSTVGVSTTTIDGFSKSDGHAVGAGIAMRRTEAGERIAGQRVGLTYAAIWDRVGLDHPVWAPVFEDGVHIGDDVVVTRIVAPKLEIEAVLGFDKPVALGADRDQFADAVTWARQITPLCDEEAIGTSSVTDVFGGNLDAVYAVLANADVNPIRAGDAIATGALTRGAHPSKAGNRWIVSVSDAPSFEPIEVRLT
jgi:2-keto-4-pentenoate hydratase